MDFNFSMIDTVYLSDNAHGLDRIGSSVMMDHTILLNGETIVENTKMRVYCNSQGAKLYI